MQVWSKAQTGSRDFLYEATHTATGTHFVGTITLSNVSTGTANANRRIVIYVHGTSVATVTATYDSGGGATAMTTVTQNSGNDGSENTYAGIISANISSGSTATFVFTMTGGALGTYRISIYQANFVSSTIAAGGSDYDTNATNGLTASVTVPTGGMSVAAATTYGFTNSWTWTNATELYDAVVSSYTVATHANSTSTGTYTITADASGVSGGALVTAVLTIG